MNTRQFARRENWFAAIGSGLVTLVAVLSATPTLAQNSNFGTVRLAPGFAAASGVAQGFTQGSVSLASIANRDRAGNLCLGFAASTPDHIVTLERDFARLSFQVDSGGGDTTLLIQGPNNTIRCGDDTNSSKDASVIDTNWRSGTYRVWVGSFDSNVRYNYTLTIRE